VLPAAAGLLLSWGADAAAQADYATVQRISRLPEEQQRTAAGRWNVRPSRPPGHGPSQSSSPGQRYDFFAAVVFVVVLLVEIVTFFATTGAPVVVVVVTTVTVLPIASSVGTTDEASRVYSTADSFGRISVNERPVRTAFTVPVTVVVVEET
jgi:hypothetical protein